VMEWEVEALDPGPIRYQDTMLFDDADLEHALDYEGLVPSDTTYRLITIPLVAIADVKSMRRWRPAGASYLAAVEQGVDLPPLVVMPVLRPLGFARRREPLAGLPDGWGTEGGGIRTAD